MSARKVRLALWLGLFLVLAYGWRRAQTWQDIWMALGPTWSVGVMTEPYGVEARLTSYGPTPPRSSEWEFDYDKLDNRWEGGAFLLKAPRLGDGRLFVPWWLLVVALAGCARLVERLARRKREGNAASPGPERSH